jgi:uncharacterized protein YraI
VAIPVIRMRTSPTGLGMLGAVLLGLATLVDGGAAMSATPAAAVVDRQTVVRSPIGQVRWTTFGIAARPSPSKDRPALFAIAAGSPVRIRRAADRAQWYLVTSVGWSGWVPARSTSPTLRVPGG